MHGGDDQELEKLLKDKYNKDIYKMTRQDFLMSQIDLEPIESNYSAEQKQHSYSQVQNQNMNSGKH